MLVPHLQDVRLARLRECWSAHCMRLGHSQRGAVLAQNVSRIFWKTHRSQGEVRQLLKRCGALLRGTQCKNEREEPMGRFVSFWNTHVISCKHREVMISNLVLGTAALEEARLNDSEMTYVLGCTVGSEMVLYVPARGVYQGRFERTVPRGGLAYPFELEGLQAARGSSDAIRTVSGAFKSSRWRPPALPHLPTKQGQ